MYQIASGQAVSGQGAGLHDVVASGGAGIVVEARAQTTSDGTFNTTQDHALPSGITAGDLLILIVRIGASRTASTPSGWTLLTTAFGANQLNYVFYKTASGSEGSSVTVTVNAASHQTGLAYRISGADHTKINIATATATLDPPVSTTVGATENLFIACAGARAGAANPAFTTFPTGYIDTQSCVYAPSANDQHSLIASCHKIATATSDDPDAFAITGANSNPDAWTIVVEPA